MTATSDAVDLVVVGHGIAGLSAAVSAAECGAKVILLERAPKEDCGGNTRWTDALMRLKSVDAVADDFEDHFAANAGHHLDPAVTADLVRDADDQPAILRTLGMTDPEVIATFADRVPPTLTWLQSHGVRFDFQPTYFITTCTPRMGPTGGGLALVEALLAKAEALNVDTWYETAATGLIRDGNRIAGVTALGADHTRLSIMAKSTMLACGGFEGNAEMLTHYLGPSARYIRPVARGGYYNKGEGIRMALKEGAATAGDFGAIHAEPLDPRSGLPEPIVLVFNYGVLVTRDGNRFVDEAPATVDATYEAITREIHAQPESLAYAVFDSGIDDVPNWQRCVRSDVPPFEAETLDGLAAQIGIAATALARTIDAYNAACPADATAFKPLETDGLATAVDYTPSKSNWARRIAKPPFRAYPIMCGNCFTFGGLKVDPDARVLNTDGEAIPGLYAAGETMGIYYGTYTGATSVLRGAVFGRIAGEGAALRASTEE